MRRGFHVVASCGVVAGAGTILYEWDIGGKRVELVVKCYVNERRQMAVCTCLHVKGDAISCGIPAPQMTPSLALPHRDNAIEEIKRLDALLDLAGPDPNSITPRRQRRGRCRAGASPRGSAAWDPTWSSGSL